MARIGELSDQNQDPAQSRTAAKDASEHGPSLPPAMAEPKLTVDELVADLKKSPFFMTSLDDAGEDNPEVEAIKALIYEGTRGEQASNFKEQGNEDARLKNWRDAREQYSKGLAALKTPRKEQDPAGEDEDVKESGLREVLLVNRSLCQLELKNYRSCSLDCLAALEINPRNIKAHFRMASAFFALDKLDEAAASCQAGLLVDSSSASLQTLQAKVLNRQDSQIAKAKKSSEEQEHKQKIKATLNQALKARRIRTRTTGQPPEMEDAEIKLVPDPLSIKSTLVFPVIILYPLHLQSDFIKAFGEEQTLQGHLDYLLPLPWDTISEYNATDVEAYIATAAGGLIKWGKKVELLKVLSGGKIEIVDGLLKVNLVPKNRAAEWIDSFKKSKGK